MGKVKERLPKMYGTLNGAKHETTPAGWRIAMKNESA
jgi:hypothetical protein